MRYNLNTGVMAHMFGQLKVEKLQKKGTLARGVQTLATLSLPHRWPITARSGCECRQVSVGKLQKWPCTAISNPP